MRALLPIIFILIAVGLFFVAVNPLYKDVSQLRADLGAYSTALTRSTELQKVRDALLDSYNSISTDQKNKLNRLLPNTVDNIQLILQIQQVASAHGLTITNIRFDAPAAEEAAPGARVGVSSDPAANRPYGVFDLEFRTQARYQDFVSFLKDMEQNLRLVDVTEINFTVPVPITNARGEVVNPDIFIFDLKLQTYWLK